MIKTIDTRNITDIMLEAQNVIDGTTTYSDPLSFKDAADIFIAMTEAAPAVEPAHKYTSVYAGNVVGIYKDGEQMTIDQIVADLNAKAVEPAMLNTCLSNAKQEQSGWLRAIDEALVCHHVGVANVSDTYEQAKDKLNKMLCVVQDIGSYFAKQEPAQAVPVAWLPIETAPKDGTEILVTYGKQGFVMQLVRFDRTFNYWKNKGEAELGLENNATHWMPIPDPRKPLYTAPPAIDDETRKMALLIREAVNKGIFQGAMHMDAISILSRLTIFHGGENDSSR